MTIKVNLKSLAVSVLSGAVAFGTVTGTVQEFIHFADPINEMLFAFIAASASIISLITSIEK